MSILSVVGEWMGYFGRFHPVVVHLPIGILFLVFILELLAWKSNQQQIFRQPVLISLFAGCLSAILSCLFGWFLSWDGGYPENTLNLHLWMGVGVALLAGAAWWVKYKQKSSLRSPLVYRTMLVGLFLLLFVTGHLGGNMTHGADYLTAGIPQPVAGWLGVEEGPDSLPSKPVITDLQQAVVYNDLVVPVLGEKCYSCHSSKKIKGALRMDTENLLFKGGKHGVIIEPGKAGESEMIKRLLLPLSDDEHMAPKDQPQLTTAEVDLLTWWIETGADTKKKVADLMPDSVRLAQLQAFVSGETAEEESKPTPLSAIYSQDITAAPAEVLEALQKKGVLINPVAKEKNWLELSCVNFPEFDGGLWPELLKLSDQVVSLKLDQTRLTDADMKQVTQFKNLVRLSISGTRVSGAGLEPITQLKQLEYINIVNTKVDDAGLQHLAEIPTLRQIYCWNEVITNKGIEQLKKKLPAVQITGRIL